MEQVARRMEIQVRMRDLLRQREITEAAGHFHLVLRVQCLFFGRQEHAEPLRVVGLQGQSQIDPSRRPQPFRIVGPEPGPRAVFLFRRERPGQDEFVPRLIQRLATHAPDSLGPVLPRPFLEHESGVREEGLPVGRHGCAAGYLLAQPQPGVAPQPPGLIGEPQPFERLRIVHDPEIVGAMEGELLGVIGHGPLIVPQRGIGRRKGPPERGLRLRLLGPAPRVLPQFVEAPLFDQQPQEARANLQRRRIDRHGALKGSNGLRHSIGPPEIVRPMHPVAIVVSQQPLIPLREGVECAAESIPFAGGIVEIQHRQEVSRLPGALPGPLCQVGRLHRRPLAEHADHAVDQIVRQAIGPIKHLIGAFRHLRLLELPGQIAHRAPIVDVRVLRQRLRPLERRQGFHPSIVLGKQPCPFHRRRHCGAERRLHPFQGLDRSFRPPDVLIEPHQLFQHGPLRLAPSDGFQEVDRLLSPSAGLIGFD